MQSRSNAIWLNRQLQDRRLPPATAPTHRVSKFHILTTLSEPEVAKRAPRGQAAAQSVLPGTPSSTLSGFCSRLVPTPTRNTELRRVPSTREPTNPCDAPESHCTLRALPGDDRLTQCTACRGCWRFPRSVVTVHTTTLPSCPTEASKRRDRSARSLMAISSTGPSCASTVATWRARGCRCGCRAVPCAPSGSSSGHQIVIVPALVPANTLPLADTPPPPWEFSCSLCMKATEVTSAEWPQALLDVAAPPSNFQLSRPSHAERQRQCKGRTK